MDVCPYGGPLPHVHDILYFGGPLISTQTNAEGLILQLKAANDLNLIVIVSAQNKVHIDEMKESHRWLQQMLEEGRIWYAVDVLDLLELALDGRYMRSPLPTS